MTAPPPYRGKRAFDVAALVVLAAPAAVLSLLCAVLVKVTSRGPVLFTQTRVGWNGQPFELLKFRSMEHKPGGNKVFLDPSEITGFGRVLRRLSLDELPQLVNVARGEMSIVGPRPTHAYQVERYDERQRVRLCVRPGLTGLAQVRERNAATWAQRIEHDLEYIERQSPLLDLRIVLQSVGKVLVGSGVEGQPEDDEIARPPG